MAVMVSEKGLNVVVLEEGSHFTHRNYNQDPAKMMAMMYRDSATTVAFGVPPVSLTLGKCIGGTTTINSATCFRTPEKVVIDWADHHDCKGLNYRDLQPFLEKVEGEINVTELPDDILGNVFKVVKRGASKLGLKAKPLHHNVKNCQGAGACQWGCVKNAKQSTDISYLPKAVGFGAQIYANCKATKLVVESGRVRAVKGYVINPETGKKNFSVTVRANIVCLAMGSLITPAFLLRQRLANFSGMVGRGLTIHPCGRVVAEMDEVVNGHHGVSQGGQIDAFEDEGIMLEGIFIPPGILSMALPGVGEDIKHLAKNYSKLAAFGVQVKDSTRGRVFPSVVGGSPYTAWYSINRTDIEKIRKGIGHICEIFLSAGAKRVFTGCYKMPVVKSRKDLTRFRNMKIKPWYFELVAFHPLGTCRMGNNPLTSVVDLNLEAHDIKGLFIPDGSPVPTALGVNPQITIMALATKTAEYIVANFTKYNECRL